MIHVEPVARTTGLGIIARAREVALRFQSLFATRLQGITTVALPTIFKSEESKSFADSSAFLDCHSIVIVDRSGESATTSCFCETPVKGIVFGS